MTLIKLRYNPNCKVKWQNQVLRDNTSTNLPSNLLSFKQNLLFGNGFIVYK